jgi:type VI secretion system protein ImpH
VSAPPDRVEPGAAVAEPVMTEAAVTERAAAESAAAERATQALLASARRADFFQLVRLLARTRPGTSLPGGPGPASGESVRFRATPSMGFAASDVDSVVPSPAAPERYEVTVNFMGLYGPASPMPNHFTEDLMWSGIDGEAERAFLDLFNHRMVSFVFRSWQKYRHPVQFDAAEPDAFTRRMLCLIGLGTAGMAEASGLDAVRLLKTAGAFVSRRRSAAGLEGVLREHFPGIGVRVVPNVERWASLPADQRMRLGKSGARLGRDACVGERVRDRSTSFRIELGPLERVAFRAFLPDGENLPRLARLVRLYVADPLDFEVLLRLTASEVPALAPRPEENLPLGQMSWLLRTHVREGRALIRVRRVDPLGDGIRGETQGTPRALANGVRASGRAGSGEPGGAKRYDDARASARGEASPAAT